MSKFVQHSKSWETMLQDDAPVSSALF